MLYISCNANVPKCPQGMYVSIMTVYSLDEMLGLTSSFTRVGSLLQPFAMATASGNWASLTLSIVFTATLNTDYELLL